MNQALSKMDHHSQPLCQIKNQVDCVEIRCPACDSEKWVLCREFRDVDYGTPGVWHSVRCLQCKHIYLNPRPTPEAFSLIYPKHYVPYQMEYSAKKRWLMRNAIEHAYEGKKIKTLKKAGIGPESIVLDVGCGAGFFLSLLKRQGFKAIGIEPDFERVNAGVHQGLDIRSGTLLSAEIKNNSVDVITLWHSLEHDPEAKKSLDRCAEILRNDGNLIIEVPDCEARESKWFGNYFWGYDAPRHVHHFSKDSLTRFVEAHGFQLKSLYRVKNPTSWVWSFLKRFGINWYANMERNIGRISILYMLFAPLYYLLSKGDFITAVFIKKGNQRDN